MSRRKRTPLEEAVDKELIAKGADVIHDFDLTQGVVIPAKKRESKLISIRLPLEMMQALRDIAVQSDDVGYQRIIKRYIQEGLERAKRNGSTKEHAVFQRMESLEQRVAQLEKLRGIARGIKPGALREKTERHI